jgi:nucleotide-binding universal stress UspA family protein
MYRSLLVPLDGSTLAEQALPFALSIARRSGATLQVVHVHVPYQLMYVDSMSPFGAFADQSLQEQERVYLDGVVKRLAAVSSVPVTASFLDGPEIAEALQGYAAAQPIDLLVMTTHGHGPLTRFWLGSVADELVRRAAVPLLLVRPREAMPDLAHEPAVKHILIPLDGSELAEQVLEPAMALGSLMQADYALLRVIRPAVSTDLDTPDDTLAAALKPPVEELRATAQAYLDRVAERLRAQAFAVQTRVVAGRQVAVAILNEAQEGGLDLIALETRARRGLARLLLGSVADKVLRGASTPVLLHTSTGKGNDHVE